MSIPFTHPYQRFNRVIKLDNEVIAGITATVYSWDVMEIEVVWVKENFRHKGYATALLQDMEQRAKEMKCNLIHLDTFDFQAKGLYEKVGYTVFGTLEDCPKGHKRYYMSKKIN